MRTISSSIALSTRGRPGLRCFEPSNLRATSLRYHPRMVSGRAAVATSPSALRPSRRPISPSFARSASESFGRPFNWSLRIRFSAARYSIPQQQLVVHRPADVGQDACPLHELPHLPAGSQCPPLIAPNNVMDNARRAHAEWHKLPNLSCSANFLAIRPAVRGTVVGVLQKPGVHIPNLREFMRVRVEGSLGEVALDCHRLIKRLGAKKLLDRGRTVI